MKAVRESRLLRLDFLDKKTSKDLQVHKTFSVSASKVNFFLNKETKPRIRP